MIRMLDRVRATRLAPILVGTLAISACSSAPRIPYTVAEARIADIPGIPQARVAADAPMAAFQAMMPTSSRNLSYLALSGGGGDGAYGAGVLNGWSATGTRPTFDLVSGVSTGALMAPFAFLGSAYDPVLADIYTSGVASSLVKDPDLFNVVLGSGLFGDQRLRDLVGRYVNPDLLAAVAAEHVKGRRLLVVTTNLDSKRAVVWNMGAIAASGAPQALQLFRDVLTASASVPGVFEPQLLDVEADGRAFQELHVDGVVATSVFTIPQAALLDRGKLKIGRSDIYVLMNGRIVPSFDLVENGTIPIVEQTLATGSQTRARQNLATTFAFARDHRMGFHLAFIDEAAPRAGSSNGFDTIYMRTLYQIGLDKARAGTAWSTTLPGSTAAPAAIAAR